MQNLLNHGSYKQPSTASRDGCTKWLLELRARLHGSRLERSPVEASEVAVLLNLLEPSATAAKANLHVLCAESFEQRLQIIGLVRVLDRLRKRPPLWLAPSSNSY